MGMHWNLWDSIGHPGETSLQPILGTSCTWIEWMMSSGIWGLHGFASENAAKFNAAQATLLAKHTMPNLYTCT